MGIVNIVTNVYVRKRQSSRTQLDQGEFAVPYWWGKASMEEGGSKALHNFRVFWLAASGYEGWGCVEWHCGALGFGIVFRVLRQWFAWESLIPQGSWLRVNQLRRWCPGDSTRCRTLQASPREASGGWGPITSH